MIGKVFGRLTVKHISHRNNGVVWLCLCSCGKSALVKTGHLNAGYVRSCGCLQKEKAKENLKPGANCHGFPHAKNLKNLYRNMHDRCENPNNKRYHCYGARNIKVCSEWGDRKTFYKWCVNNGYKPGLQIHRIDNDGDYCPDNCAFVTRLVNMNNMSRNRMLTWDKKPQSASDWARELGVKPQALIHRVTRGWDLQRMFEQPFRKPKIK